MQELTDKHYKFIDTYLSTKDMTECCKKCDISRNTGYNYLKIDAVKQEIDSRRTQLMQDTTIFMQRALQDSSRVLIDIINDSQVPASVRVSAINSLFANCNKLTEQTDILVKLADIEQRLDEKEDNK